MTENITTHNNTTTHMSNLTLLTEADQNFIYCFPAKSKDWFSQNRDNVSVCGLLFHCAVRKNPTQHVGLHVTHLLIQM
jgi:hypothetical protein